MRKVEGLIRADFRNGLPPHLQANAKSLSYCPGSDQSRIFVSSHAEFSSLPAREVQKLLSKRIILVHGTPIDFRYGWDLESFGRLYDVDKKTTVHGEIIFHLIQWVWLKQAPVSTHFDAHNPELRHHQGTLREFHEITKKLAEDCPPLNAISLPGHRRNLFVPPQFGSLASHEVAQSRVPSEYDTKFQVPELKSHLEWSLIGARGSVSPFHVDPEGLNTVVVVLEGGKYWILMTEMGDDLPICSIDSLGASWNPYFVNEGDNVDRFRFEGVHLQKGDML